MARIMEEVTFGVVMLQVSLGFFLDHVSWQIDGGLLRYGLIERRQMVGDFVEFLREYTDA